MNWKHLIKPIVSFIILFLLYHAAEYMIVFKNNVAGFFTFQFLFFTVAYICGNWYKKNGFATWGLPFFKGCYKLIMIGIVAGILLYAIPYFFSIATGIETIISSPKLDVLIVSSLPFAFGVFFSSFSEDILTRGIAYSVFNGSMKTRWIILLSSLIYLLNHIYRMGDGLESLLYIFLLGIVFIIPVIFTKNLWLTGSMHWAGNTFFFITHNLIQTKNESNVISSNYLFAIFILLFIPLIWRLSKKLSHV